MHSFICLTSSKINILRVLVIMTIWLNVNPNKSIKDVKTERVIYVKIIYCSPA